MGLYFVGLDAIGDYLREVNVTRPLGHHLDVWIARFHNLFVIVPRLGSEPLVINGGNRGRGLLPTTRRTKLNRL